MKFAPSLKTLSLSLAWSLSLGLASLAQTGTTTGPGPTTPTGPTKPADVPLEQPKGAKGEPEKPKDDKKDDPEFFGQPVDSETDSVVFVIDRSGSMGWDSKSFTGLNGQPTRGDRLTRAKTELIRAVGALTENFKFNMVAYDCSITKWKSSGTVKADDGNKAGAYAWINSLDPGGGTMTGPSGAEGLRIDSENKLVVLLTDGSPNCGGNSDNDHRRQIRQANKQNAKVDVFGVGVDGSDLRSFCQGVAADNGGRYVEVP